MPTTESAGAGGATAAAPACPEAPCLSRELANWRMPNSKQAPLPNPPRLAAADLGEVEDEMTGLVWEASAAALSDYHGAQDHCEELRQQTSVAWRLPTRIELVTLVELSRPSIDTKYFSDTPVDYFWTQSPVAGREAARYSVYFGLGETAVALEQHGAHTRCVRAGKRTASPQFQIEEQVVVDRATELVWQRQVPSARLGLEAARWYCEGIEPALMATSFRLPSAKELQTLVDIRVSEGPLIDTAAFPDTPAAAFWSEDVLDSPRRVDFASGTSTVTDVGDENHVRCVGVG